MSFIYSQFMTMWDFSFSIVLKKWEVWNGRWENNWNLKTYNKLDNQITVQFYIKNNTTTTNKNNYENCVRLCVTVKKTIHYFHAPTKLFVIQKFNLIHNILLTSRVCAVLFYLLDYGTCLGTWSSWNMPKKLEDNVFFLKWSTEKGKTEFRSVKKKLS